MYPFTPLRNRNLFLLNILIMRAAVNYCRATKRDYVRYVDVIVKMYPAEQPVSKSIFCCICMNILMYVPEFNIC
jgi:hypothetical protein